MVGEADERAAEMRETREMRENKNLPPYQRYDPRYEGSN